MATTKKEITAMQMDTNNFSIQLEKVECESFSIEERVNTVEIVPENLQVAHRIALEIQSENSVIVVQIDLKYMIENKDLSGLTLCCSFKISPFHDMVIINKDAGTVDFEEVLLFSTIPVAFSTTRGYFQAKLEGTPLATYPYPIIQVQELMKQVKILPPKG